MTTHSGMLLLPSPVTVVYNSEFSVPADDVTVEFPYIKGCEDGDFLYGFDGENLVFKGQIDEIITKSSGEKITVKITARSMASVLLDNEAEPCIYFNASSSVIFERHLQPFGFNGYIGDNNPYFGYIKISKGMSQWQVLENYCVNKYGKKPRITGDGKISYAMFMGQLGNVEAIYRTQYGVEDADAVITAAGKPALEYFDASNTDKYQVDQDGNWSATAANNYMTTNLSQYNESAGNMIELVICNNDGMAEGVISALNDKGYNLGDGNCTTIPVFGVDATDAAKQLIADGKMTGTIKQDAEGMANGIAYLAKNIQAGKDLMADTDSFNISKKVSNKIYIPYATYTGE